MKPYQAIVKLEEITSNPYQPRTLEDPAHVVQIAQSILQDGLLQIPAVRIHDGKYQLAFGHTRLAAYKLLDAALRGLADGKEGPDIAVDLSHHRDDLIQPLLMLISTVSGRPADAYSEMPVTVQAMTDEDMFRRGVVENVNRRNLTAIEEARSMARYRDEFKKTSAEIGELYGLSDSSVRNKLRLLKLPDDVQEMVLHSEIAEYAARLMLPMYDLPDFRRDQAESSSYPDIRPSEILASARRGDNTEVIQAHVNRLLEIYGPRQDPPMLKLIEAAPPSPEPEEPPAPVFVPAPVVSAPQPIHAPAQPAAPAAQKYTPPARPAAPTLVQDDLDDEDEDEEETPAPVGVLRPVQAAAPAKPAEVIPALKPVATESPAKTWDQTQITMTLDISPVRDNGLRYVQVSARINDSGFPMFMGSWIDEFRLPQFLIEIRDRFGLE
jgi:ParB-like chromosome segregation protein Spo0J